MISKYSNKLTVNFSPEVKDFLEFWMDHDNYRMEAGGLIIGTMEASTQLTITDITTPQLSDHRLPFRFFRSETSHQEKMDELWEESGFRKLYLGEWHTHPEPYPHPSFVDISGWKKIASKKQNSSWMLFLILGQRGFRLWTVENGKIKELTLYAK
ncbi:hypothetical protein A7X67_11070 [Clostridium sp. W14A]|nr:hypothetical protein A7X67_11070 [Clostridium sp. W14A]